MRPLDWGRSTWRDTHEADEDEPPVRAHAQGGPDRGRAREPPPAASRRHDSQGGGRPLHLPAAGLALHHEDREHRTRRDGQRGRPGAHDAHHGRRRPLAPERPHRRLRQGAHPLPRPPRARVRPGPHARGDRHGARAQRASQLQAAPRKPLPHPGQVPRRVPPALRPHARPRVHHEGRLQLLRHAGEPAGGVRQDEGGLRQHLRALRPQGPARRG